MHFFNIRFCLTCWRFSATHPENIGNTRLSLIFFLNVALNLTFQVLAALLLVYEGDSMDIMDVSAVLESWFALCHGLLTLVPVYVKRASIGDILRSSKDLWVTEGIKDEILKASCEKTLHNLRRLYVIYMSVAGVAGMVVFALRPLISKGEALALMCYVPEGIPTGLVDIVQVYTFLTTIHLPVISFDGIFLTLAILIQVQFKVLNHDLKTLFEYENSDSKEEDIKEKIGKWVDRHNTLLGSVSWDLQFLNSSPLGSWKPLVKQIDRVFSVPLLLYSGYVTIGMCFELYLILTQEEFNSGPYLVIVAVVFEFIVCYCVPAQILINEAEKISGNAWESSWYKEPTSSTRAAMNMILMGSRKTISINAVIIPINLMTCLSTLKTMVSYSMFLRTVGAKED